MVSQLGPGVTVANCLLGLVLPLAGGGSFSQIATTPGGGGCGGLPPPPPSANFSGPKVFLRRLGRKNSAPPEGGRGMDPPLKMSPGMGVSPSKGIP